MKMFNESRINRRITLSLPINYEVLDKETKESDTTSSKDISEGGIRLVFKKFYPPKTKFLLKISLNQINRMIETTAQTVWSSNVRFSNMYHIGLRFVDLSIPNQNILREFIAIKEITSNII